MRKLDNRFPVNLYFYVRYSHIFNERCWVIGSSIKDAGKKALNIVECIDSKQAIVTDAEQKWMEGVVYL